MRAGSFWPAPTTCRRQPAGRADAAPRRRRSRALLSPAEALAPGPHEARRTRRRGRERQRGDGENGECRLRVVARRAVTRRLETPRLLRTSPWRALRVLDLRGR